MIKYLLLSLFLSSYVIEDNVNAEEEKETVSLKEVCLNGIVYYEMMTKEFYYVYTPKLVPYGVSEAFYEHCGKGKKL